MELAELRLVYRITLSARTSTFGGIVRPICLAVFELITNSAILLLLEAGPPWHLVNHEDTGALTLPALVQIINKTTLVQHFNEAHIDKVLRLGSLCLGVRLRQRL
jgi:hypothetical protein